MSPSQELVPPPAKAMVWVPGGTFLMGSEDLHAEERLVHRVRVDGFWMDGHPVSTPPAAASKARRQGETVDASTSHIGFRCVVRSAPSAD